MSNKWEATFHPSDGPADQGTREALAEHLAEAIDKAACEAMGDCSAVHVHSSEFARAVLPVVAAQVEAAVSVVRAERDEALASARTAWDVHREHVDLMNPRLLHERARAEAAESERDALREKVARVEALRCTCGHAEDAHISGTGLCAQPFEDGSGVGGCKCRAFTPATPRREVLAAAIYRLNGQALYGRDLGEFDGDRMEHERWRWLEQADIVLRALLVPSPAEGTGEARCTCSGCRATPGGMAQLLGVAPAPVSSGEAGERSLYLGIGIDKARCAACAAYPDLPCAVHRHTPVVTPSASTEGDAS